MPASFFERLRAYYLDVVAVLRGEASASSIFPNSTDVGMSRERVYAEFLRQHAPSKCNVFFGGFLFGKDGSESGQLDVIVTTDTTPKFNLHNRNGDGKSFSPVEGCLAVASIKSMLNKAELEDALLSVGRIPPTTPLGRRINPMLKVNDYDDWPYKIIYATDGVAPETLMGHLNNFYELNAGIPLSRRPNVIHVSGKYVIFRLTAGLSVWDRAKKEEAVPIGNFHLLSTDPDLQGVLWVLDNLQQRATISAHILFSYSGVIDRINELPAMQSKQEPNNALQATREMRAPER